MSRKTDRWRTKEQVLLDLADALHFSANSLERNRNGRLGPEQLQSAALRLLRPVGTAAAYAFAPVLVWTLLAMLSGHEDFSTAWNSVRTTALHPKELFQDHGWLTCLVIIGATIASIGMGAHHAASISFALFFDLVERAVIVKEGRIEGREDQTFRKSGRDPLEHYFFDLKTERFTVNRAAFLALDSGAAYYVYLLPRSRILVALEPKVIASDLETVELLPNSPIAETAH